MEGKTTTIGLPVVRHLFPSSPAPRERCWPSNLLSIGDPLTSFCNFDSRVYSRIGHGLPVSGRPDHLNAIHALHVPKSEIQGQKHFGINSQTSDLALCDLQ